MSALTRPSINLTAMPLVDCSSCPLVPRRATPSTLSVVKRAMVVNTFGAIVIVPCDSSFMLCSCRLDRQPLSIDRGLLPWSLLHHHAAIDAQHLSGNECRFIGGEK